VSTKETLNSLIKEYEDDDNAFNETTYALLVIARKLEEDRTYQQVWRGPR
jgi:hypothetical protein